MNLHVQAPAAERVTLKNATLVLPDGVAHQGSITLAGGLIETVEADTSKGLVVDCGGDVVMPGIVDIHTDHFEKHIYPRSHVRWDALKAALAHDAQVIGSGITTVFDSLWVGKGEENDTRREILAPMLDALEAGVAAGMFKADHLVHLRCEITDEYVLTLLDEHYHRPIIQVASIMDHTPGAKQSCDLSAYIERRMKETGWHRGLVEEELERKLARVAGVVDRVRHKALAHLQTRGIALMSHDDVTVDHVAEAHGDGISIAEFPTTVEAAAAARAHNMSVVAGAPNYLRGGSQTGNVAVAELLAENLVDILASDYVPRAILDAVFAIAADEALPMDLAATSRMASLNPARAAGLTDRGALAPGQRADLLRIGLHGSQPFVRTTWREGLPV
ncbi:MAG: alpha-D-ribose 1-methylphosphonate 5-triphosphate diphosphatase [Pseudomonadota bacterium]